MPEATIAGNFENDTTTFGNGRNMYLLKHMEHKLARPLRSAQQKQKQVQRDNDICFPRCFKLHGKRVQEL
jgi:hypothetical protein